MANSLAEGFIRITYTGLSGVHHAQFPVNYEGSPVSGVEPTLTEKDGGTILAIAGLEGFLDVYRGMFHTSTLFGLAEAYKVDPDTEERTFLFGWDIGDIGMQADPALNMGMVTVTFKTVGGGVLKIVAMEGMLGLNQKLYPPFATSGILDDLVQYVISSNSILIGRDDDVPFAAISMTSKTSDALRKRNGLS